MDRPTSSLSAARRAFLVVFLVSAFVLIVLFVVRGEMPFSGGQVQPTPAPGTVPGVPIYPTAPATDLDLASLLSVISAVCSVLSLLGLAITTYLTWRKNQVELRLAAVDHELKLVQLETAKTELARLKEEKASKGP